MGKPAAIAKGRGAPSNRSSARFAAPAQEADGDWLDEAPLHGEGAAKPATRVVAEPARSILSFNTSPDIPFDRSVNPYRGCEHGCIYCYARPTHAWLDLSPGLDFETRLFAKPDAARLLRETFARPGYRPAPLALGTNTDAYQPIERDWKLTRQVLEVCLEAGHPVTITTKSDRVLRDLDILAEMGRRRLAAVAISVTSLDATLSRRLEPRAASPDKRLAALAALADAGVPVHCSISPVIPALTDEWMEAIVARAAEAGARSAGWIPLRLPHEVAPLFREWLALHYPDRAAKVMAIVQEMRGGRDNDPGFFTRMQAQGTWADLLRARFRLACRRAGISGGKLELDSTAFVPPAANGQMRLL